MALSKVCWLPPFLISLNLDPSSLRHLFPFHFPSEIWHRPVSFLLAWSLLFCSILEIFLVLLASVLSVRLLPPVSQEAFPLFLLAVARRPREDEASRTPSFLKKGVFLSYPATNSLHGRSVVTGPVIQPSFLPILPLKERASYPTPCPPCFSLSACPSLSVSLLLFLSVCGALFCCCGRSPCRLRFLDSFTLEAEDEKESFRSTFFCRHSLSSRSLFSGTLSRKPSPGLSLLSFLCAFFHCGEPTEDAPRLRFFSCLFFCIELPSTHVKTAGSSSEGAAMLDSSATFSSASFSPPPSSPFFRDQEADWHRHYDTLLQAIDSLSQSALSRGGGAARAAGGGKMPSCSIFFCLAQGLLFFSPLPRPRTF